MAQRNETRQRAVFLPEGMREFMRRRAVELLGLGLLALAGALAAALASYNPADPSWSTATGAAPTNWLGLPGAHAADLILQTSGLAGVLPALVLAAWAWRVISHRGLPMFWLRLTALVLCLIAAATFASALPAPSAWPLATGLGGFYGDLFHNGAARALAAFGLDTWPYTIVVATGVIALALLLFVLSISLADWGAAGRGGLWATKTAGRGVQTAGATLARIGRGAARHVRREPRLVPGDADDAPDLDERPEPTMARAAKRRVTTPARKPKKSRRARAEEQPKFNLGSEDGYQLPPLALLQEPGDQARIRRVNEEALEQNARLLESVLDDYGVRGRIIKVRPGPVVTLYELEPAPGTKTSRVIGLSDDIARSMSAVSVRVAVVPGRNAIGIELPNQDRETVYLRELLATSDYESANATLSLALGKDISGAPIIADLAKMPHLLIAGTTGSGKSVAINTMILSLLYRQPPEQCRLIMIDPKMLELSVYDDIPHLLTPVVTDPGKAVVALKWTVREMENRYKAMARLTVRNIAGYNQRLAQAKAKGETLTRTVQTGFDTETGEPIFEEQELDMEPMPHIVVVVDEMADLMMVAGKDIEGAIQRLAQMARAAGIHIIMATQRPSVDVITGTIKANFPTRISFQVTSKVDSRTILGEQGAEQLLGQGDMLYMAGGGRITRVHGPFVSDGEVEQVVAYLRAQGEPEYLSAVTEDLEPEDDGGMGAGPAGGSGDALFDQAVDVVSRHQKASTSFIQRHLQIGYNRAARLMERMEEEGIVGPANHVGKREIHVRKPDEF